MWGIIAKHDVWRADREAEGARLLSEYRTKSYLGFESPALRQTIRTQSKEFDWVFFFFAGKSIKSQSIPKSLKFSLDAVSHQWHFSYCNAALPQLDRGSDYESERHRFESYTPHQIIREPRKGLLHRRRYLSWIEGLTTNQNVIGSNPIRRTRLSGSPERGSCTGGVTSAG